MKGRLCGKTALVTAAAQGIGKSTAERFAAEGAVVFATDVNAQKLDQVRNCTPYVLDVTDQAGIEALAAEIGAIDVLLNCAGFVHHGNVLDCTESDWDFSFNLNVKSMYRMIRAFLPKMLEVGGGSIVNMSSVASSIRGVPDRFAYAATKAAVIGMTKAIAADFVERGIRCNAICPGTVHSPSLDSRLRSTGDYDATLREFTARQPMGRLGDPDEIAALALYLGSDESSFTTGQIHIIDGGWCN